ncbi:MAG: FTR1 family protein [Candidatus Altiarchaeota archaeon]
MLSELIITFRETLEAALVIGIVLAYLERTKQSKYNSVIYLAIVSAVVGSIIAAYGFNTLAGGFSGRSEEIFEGVVMLFAALLLTTMILWMMRQTHIREEIEQKVGHEISEGHRLGLFALVFVSVLREGVETVIFLGASSLAGEATAYDRIVGGFLGIILALALGFIIFVQARKLDVRKFFQATSIVLVLFAAGLVAHGVHELQEAGVLPTYIEHLWDVNPPQNPDGSYPLLHENGLIGGLAKDLLGYNGNPSLLEAASYALYLLFVALAYRNIDRIHKVI